MAGAEAEGVAFVLPGLVPAPVAEAVAGLVGALAALEVEPPGCSVTLCATSRSESPEHAATLADTSKAMDATRTNMQDSRIS